MTPDELKAIEERAAKASPGIELSDFGDELDFFETRCT